MQLVTRTNESDLLDNIQMLLQIELHRVTPVSNDVHFDV
jgi:hypothetical protein